MSEQDLQYRNWLNECGKICKGGRKKYEESQTKTINAAKETATSEANSHIKKLEKDLKQIEDRAKNEQSALEQKIKNIQLDLTNQEAKYKIEIANLQKNIQPNSQIDNSLLQQHIQKIEVLETKLKTSQIDATKQQEIFSKKLEDAKLESTKQETKLKEELQTLKFNLDKNYKETDKVLSKLKDAEQQQKICEKKLVTLQDKNNIIDPSINYKKNDGETNELKICEPTEDTLSSVFHYITYPLTIVATGLITTWWNKRSESASASTETQTDTIIEQSALNDMPSASTSPSRGSSQPSSQLDSKKIILKPYYKGQKLNPTPLREKLSDHIEKIETAKFEKTEIQINEIKLVSKDSQTDEISHKEQLVSSLNLIHKVAITIKSVDIGIDVINTYQNTTIDNLFHTANNALSLYSMIPGANKFALLGQIPYLGYTLWEHGLYETSKSIKDIAVVMMIPHTLSTMPNLGYAYTTAVTTYSAIYTAKRICSVLKAAETYEDEISTDATYLLSGVCELLFDSVD